MLTPQEIEKWAGSRETSTEIASAICEVANHNELMMDRMWEHPSEYEKETVEMLAFDRCDDYELFWGELTILR